MPNSPCFYLSGALCATRKDDGREQRSPCAKCRQPINVGNLYVQLNERNGFGHARRVYWHWECWSDDLLLFLTGLRATYGVKAKVVAAAKVTLTLVE